MLVRFYGARPSKNRGYNVPNWVPRTEGFAEAVKSRWRRKDDPFEDLTGWKKAVVGATKAYFRDLKSKKASLKGDLGLFSGLVEFVKLASA